MAVRRDTPKSVVVDRPLSWAPPTMSNPRVVTVTDSDPTSRVIDLANGEDLLLQMPNVISSYSPIGTNLGMIQVNNGRHITLIGGHVTIGDTPQTVVSITVADGDVTFNVGSTAGFPPVGAFRVDGEYITYTGVTSTTFTGCTRDAGFYNTSPVSSKTTHAVGAIVYLSESYRSAFQFRNQTGTVHIEGVLIDGYPICDGIDIYGANGSTYQIQNCRIGGANGVTNYDLTNALDGHPDCIQITRGPDALLLDRVTMIQGPGNTSKCLLNSGSDGGHVLTAGTMRDVEMLSNGSLSPPLYNGDTSTNWTMLNTWAGPVPNGGALSTDSALVPKLLKKAPDDGAAEFCPASRVGEHYSSPGYL